MPISVSCQDCGKQLKAPDSLAGKKAKCPQCGAVVPITAAIVDAEVMDDPPPLPKRSSAGAKPKPTPKLADDEFDDSAYDDAPVDDQKSCPMCGEMIASAAAKCRFCGEVFDGSIAKTGKKRRRGGSSGYAGFWVRFVAAFADGIIALIVMIPFALIAGFGLAAVGAQNVAEPVGNLIGIVIGWLYSALQECSEHQATFGKRMMSIRVTDLDGGQISFGRASGRHFGKILSGLFCLIGYIMAGFTEKKQALHDMLASTLVVRD